MTATALHLFTVRPNRSGTKWLAAGVGHPPFSEEYATREAAFGAARVHARGHLPSQVSLYTREGAIDQVQTFGLE